MKTALIRLLALATLATSMSAFAASSECKCKDEANTSDATQQDGGANTQGEGKSQKKDKKAQDESQENKDFDRVLMGIYG